MSLYCLNHRKNTETINPWISKGNNGKTMILSKRINAYFWLSSIRL